MRPSEIVFVEQYYYPEGWGGAQIPRDITIDWAKRGFRVHVLCGADQYAKTQDESIPDPRNWGINILRIPSLGGGDVRARKVLRQLWFCAAALPRLLLNRRPGVFVTQTNPPMVVALVAAVATLSRRPLIIVAQDIYPEVMIAYGMLDPRSMAARVLQRMFAWAYRRASAVVALGPRMASRLIEKGVSADRIWQISNWATGACSVVRGASNPLISEWSLAGKFVLLYSGNFGAAHDCDTLLRGVAAARESCPDVRLVIIGDGTRIDEARRLVDVLKLQECVAFKPFVRSDQLPQTFGVASAAVVTLLPGFDGLVVPSKLLGNMARAIPTLYIGPAGSDIDFYVRESNGGRSVVNGDAGGVARCILEMARDPGLLRSMGDAARQYYDEHLSREIGLREYRRLISTIAVTGRVT